MHNKDKKHFVFRWKRENIQSEKKQHENTNYDFVLYRCINPDSICGYPFLAINSIEGIYLSIDIEHYSIDTWYWEVSNWIQEDYEATNISFNYDPINIVSLINKELSCKDYSITVYNDCHNKIYALVFTVGVYENYFECRYEIKNDIVEKKIGSRSGIEFFSLTDNTDDDVLLFKALIEQSYSFCDFKHTLFLQN